MGKKHKAIDRDGFGKLDVIGSMTRTSLDDIFGWIVHAGYGVYDNNEVVPTKEALAKHIARVNRSSNISARYLWNVQWFVKKINGTCYQMPKFGDFASIGKVLNLPPAIIGQCLIDLEYIIKNQDGVFESKKALSEGMVEVKEIKNKGKVERRVRWNIRKTVAVIQNYQSQHDASGELYKYR